MALDQALPHVAAAPTAFAPRFVIGEEQASDAFAREKLLDACFGPARFLKTCEKLRAGRLPARGLALVAHDDDRLVSTVRLWPIFAGAGRAALLLGPLAVAPDYRAQGLGAAMMETALERACARNHRAVLLVGDEPYYARFGFERRLAAGLEMPGWIDPARFLGLELASGALQGATGRVAAAGAVTAGPASAADRRRAERSLSRVA